MMPTVGWKFSLKDKEESLQMVRLFVLALDRLAVFWHLLSQNVHQAIHHQAGITPLNIGILHNPIRVITTPSHQSPTFYNKQSAVMTIAMIWIRDSKQPPGCFSLRWTLFYDGMIEHIHTDTLTFTYKDLLQEKNIYSKIRKILFNHSNTSLNTTLDISLFLSPSVLMANFSASGFPTLEQAT